VGRRKRFGRFRAVAWLWTRLLAGFAFVASAVPLPMARAAGRILGRMAFAVLRKRRRMALQNVDLAYGDSISPSEKRRIARESFENFGIVAMEFPHTPKASRDNLVRVVGREHLDDTRGALFLSAHAANWEWLAPACIAHGLPVAEVVNSYSDAERNSLIDTIRRSAGIITVPKNAAGSTLTKLLGEGTYIGILMDQSARKNAVPTTFFGRDCWTTSGPALLALRIEQPIHIALMHREADGSYVLNLSRPIAFEKSGNFREDLARFTQQVLDRIEQHVRNYPGQWMWMHNRWKSRGGAKLARWAAGSTATAAKPSEQERAAS